VGVGRLKGLLLEMINEGQKLKKVKKLQGKFGINTLSCLVNYRYIGLVSSEIKRPNKCSGLKRKQN
jgi:hypothetical protein